MCIIEIKYYVGTRVWNLTEKNEKPKPGPFEYWEPKPHRNSNLI